jgi:hypothetical protein
MYTGEPVAVLFENVEVRTRNESQRDREINALCKPRRQNKSLSLRSEGW